MFGRFPATMLRILRWRAPFTYFGARVNTTWTTAATLFKVVWYMLRLLLGEEDE
jgi:hypothetical protein